MTAITRRSALLGTLATGAAMNRLVSNARAHDQHHPEDRWSPVVALGGLPGFAAMADNDVVAALRGNGRFRLYIHNSAWLALSDAQRHALIAACGPAAAAPDIELGGWNKPARWFNKEWLRDYAPYHFGSRRGHVNETKWETWSGYVTAARQAGFTSLSPIVTPNHGQFRNGSFADADSWKTIRDACRAGGGLTVDTPVDFYFQQPEEYRAFVVSELAWARDNDLWSAAILSPGNAHGDFRSLFERTIRDLEHRGAHPDEIIVESYATRSTPLDAAIASPPETHTTATTSTPDASNTLNGAAAWLLAHTEA